MIEKIIWSLPKKPDRQIFSHQLSQPKIVTKFFQLPQLTIRFFKQCPKFFRALTKIFIVVGSIVAFDYTIKKIQATHKSSFGLPEIFIRDIEKNWLPIVVIEFNFNRQSSSDWICFQLLCIIGGNPNAWKFFLISILMDMTSNANWLGHIHFDNCGHVGMKLMPFKIIGREICLHAKGL